MAFKESRDIFSNIVYILTRVGSCEEGELYKLPWHCQNSEQINGGLSYDNDY